MTTRSHTALAVSALLVVVALAVGTLSAQGRGPGGRGLGPGGGPGPGPFPMLQRLDLTDAQKEQVRAILTETAGQETRQALGKLQQDLNDAVLADTPDPARIEQLKASIAEAEANALAQRVDVQLRIAQILTPEQREKARERPAGRRGRGARGVE
jgi:periplasmic protein CpxP/Spy